MHNKRDYIQWIDKNVCMNMITEIFIHWGFFAIVFKTNAAHSRMQNRSYLASTTTKHPKCASNKRADRFLPVEFARFQDIFSWVRNIAEHVSTSASVAFQTTTCVVHYKLMKLYSATTEVVKSQCMCCFSGVKDECLRVSPVAQCSSTMGYAAVRLQLLLL